MDAGELYLMADKEFNANNFDVALELLNKIKSYYPNYKSAYYLEAKIWRKRENPVKQFYAIENLLKLLNFSSPDEKKFIAPSLIYIGGACGELALTNENFKFQCLSADFANDEKTLFSAIDNAFFMTNCLENFSVADFRSFCDDYKKFLSRVKISPFPKQFYNHKKIRVGFLSADFRNHPVINWSWSLLTRLNKKFFATYFYSNNRFADNATNYLHTTADVWRDIYDLTDEVAAKLIRDDEIDILFDLSGHTPGNRLRVAAYRPATVQISGIGYMGSTGLDCFDYFLSDETCAGDESYFTEKVIKLPHSHICYEPPTKLEPAKFPPCIRKGYVTFGSFNHFVKITDSMLTTWKKILDKVPNSHLILKHKIFGNDDGKKFVTERLKSFGFDLKRVEMRPLTKIYLPEYGDVDIALDTFPYTGGVTTCEALYMGVSVVSLYGSRHGTRFGLSILKNIGIDELAVNSYDEYINRAVALAGDWELLTIFRKNLRGMMKKSPLMDSASYVREVEAAFIKILNDERKNFYPISQ